jgi:hypothetical protein
LFSGSDALSFGCRFVCYYRKVDAFGCPTNDAFDCLSSDAIYLAVMPFIFQAYVFKIM